LDERQYGRPRDGQAQTRLAFLRHVVAAERVLDALGSGTFWGGELASAADRL
jgi:hypothetical protein